MTLKSNQNNNSLLVGGFLILLGIYFLLDRLGIRLPHWLYRWEYIPIVAGIYSGYKRDFKNPYGWVVPILIGSFFLVVNNFDINIGEYIVPLVLISVGAVIILNTFGYKKALNNIGSTYSPEVNDTTPQAPSPYSFDPVNNTTQAQAEPNTFTNTTQPAAQQNNTAEPEANWLQVNSVFSGDRRIITSKNFTGGDIVTIMGGAEINLLNAELTQPITLSVTQIMGGIKLIIPSNWQVKNEVTTILGGIEDKRPLMNNPVYNPNHLITIKGTSIMGGLEIRSFI
jgi:predicted membrane protein